MIAANEPQGLADRLLELLVGDAHAVDLGAKTASSPTWLSNHRRVPESRVLYPGGKLPAGAITKDQIVALVTDPVFDH